MLPKFTKKNKKVFINVIGGVATKSVFLNYSIVNEKSTGGISL